MTSLVAPTSAQTSQPTTEPHGKLVSYPWVTLEDIKLLRKWLRNADRTTDTLLREDILARAKLMIATFKWRKDGYVWVQAKNHRSTDVPACVGLLVMGYSENYQANPAQQQLCYTNEQLCSLVDEIDQSLKTEHERHACVG